MNESYDTPENDKDDKNLSYQEKIIDEHIQNALREALKTEVTPLVESLEEARRTLYGEPPLNKGIVNLVKTANEELEEIKELVHEFKTIAKFSKYVLPVLGLGGLTQLLSWVESALSGM